MNDELTDEIPQAPAEGADGVQIDAELEASDLQTVHKMGEPIPQGTRHFRLRQFQAAKADDGQPYFMLQWSCQEEPYTGRVVFDNVPWVKKEDVYDANHPGPRQVEARNILDDRLAKANAIMQAAGYKPSGRFNFVEFLGTSPELKIQYNVSERKAKQPDGTYKGTGEMGNRVQRYFSLHRGA